MVKVRRSITRLCLGLAPVFVVEHPGDAELANALWPELAACAQREAPHHRFVPIDRTLEPPHDGLSHFGDEGLYAISLRPTAPPIVLAHELAHAWVRGGPPTLTEGRAELLAECAAHRRPDLVPFLNDDRSQLDRMPDLRFWSDDRYLEPVVLVAAYRGSRRLFRAIADAVPAEQLYGQPDMGWDELTPLLQTNAPLVLNVLESGVHTQRRALRDTDLDGLVNLQERMRGTHPGMWDTDGDGWWDGAPEDRPLGAVPLPPDGSPVCMPLIPNLPGLVEVQLRGQLRGIQADRRIGFIPRDNTVQLEQINLGFPGGAWLEPREAKVPNPHCQQDSRVTVVSEREGLALEKLHEGARAALDDLDRRLGPVGRLYVRVDNREWHVVQSMSRYIQITADSNTVRSNPSASGAYAAALFHTVTRELSDALAYAIARSWTKLPPPVDWGLRRREVMAWEQAVESCREGWSGLVHGRCERPGG